MCHMHPHLKSYICIDIYKTWHSLCGRDARRCKKKSYNESLTSCSEDLQYLQGTKGYVLIIYRSWFQMSLCQSTQHKLRHGGKVKVSTWLRHLQL